MNKIKCVLYCYSNSAHLQQIYTGFSLLQRQGVIDLSYKLLKEKPSDLRGAGPNGLKVVVNDAKTLFYDTFDGYQINGDILNKVDCYFKRSFSRSYVTEELNGQHKIHPLGLNYLVYENSPSLFLLQRSILEKHFRRKITNAFTSLAIETITGGKDFYVPRVNNCYASPQFDQAPRVLFMTHLWSPQANSAKSERLGLTKESLESINEMRVACIRELKKEFGERYFGGIAPDEYSIQHYRDFLLPAGNLAKKGNYMEMLRQFPICIATTGLFGSIGWKFAEYVCFSKAIVSEKLNYLVPGLDGAEENYLEFSTPESCVEAVSRLFDDRNLRTKLMINNSHYYHSFLRPDSLIMNTLATAQLN
jgi:hypothetical protein